MPDSNAPATPPAVFLPALATSVLLYSSFFPLNLGFLIYVAMVPWLFLVKIDPRPRRLYWKTWLGALCFTLPVMQWMRVAHPAMYGTWIFLAFYTAAYFVLGLALCRKLDRNGVPLWLNFPTVWVGLEYCRAHFPTGFSWLEPLGIQHHIGFGWYFLGYSQHDYLPVIQIADITGAYGVSFVVCLVNVAIFELLAGRVNALPRPQNYYSVVLAFVGIGSAIAYGYLRLMHEPFEAGPRVACLQGNIPQELKMLKGEELLEPYMQLWGKAALSDAPPPDLVVWPETSCPDDWISRIDRSGNTTGELVGPNGGESDLQRAVSRRYLALACLLGSTAPKAGLSDRFEKAFLGRVLVGVNTIEKGMDEKLWKYNSALYFNRGQYVDRYDKMHLVPFGEYVPLGSLFPWLQAFTPYRGDYSCKPGERWTRFPFRVGKARMFAAIICYEDTDPALARRHMRTIGDEESFPDFFVNISNDGWFRGTAEHEQHLAICRFRAVETRRPIVRAVNMGISAIVDADGRVVVLPGPSWSESKAMEGIAVGNVPLDKRHSLFPQLGDWLPLACWFAIAVGIFWPRFRRRKTNA